MLRPPSLKAGAAVKVFGNIVETSVLITLRKISIKLSMNLFSSWLRASVRLHGRIGSPVQGFGGTKFGFELNLMFGGKERIKSQLKGGVKREAGSQYKEVEDAKRKERRARERKDREERRGRRRCAGNDVDANEELENSLHLDAQVKICAQLRRHGKLVSEMFIGMGTGMGARMGTDIGINKGVGMRIDMCIGHRWRQVIGFSVETGWMDVGLGMCLGAAWCGQAGWQRYGSSAAEQVGGGEVGWQASKKSR